MGERISDSVSESGERSFNIILSDLREIAASPVD